MKSSGLLHNAPTCPRPRMAAEDGPAYNFVHLGSYRNVCRKPMAHLQLDSSEIAECECAGTTQHRSGRKEELPSCWQTALNSCLCGWLSQFFNLSVSSKDDIVEKNELSVPRKHHSYYFDPLSREFESSDLTHTNGSWLGYGASELKAYSVFPVEVGQTLSKSSTFASAVAENSFYRTALSEDISALGMSGHCVTPDDLGSPDGLAVWLQNRLPQGSIQLSQWGTVPGTKGVCNLWIELVEGEMVLQDACPPRRTVHVASVKIKNRAGHLLVEAHQEMADGSIRMRNRPLSEKMRPGENVEEACFRGISEELGNHLGEKSKVTILADSYRRRQEERESFSYPGLLTSYIIHSMEVVMDDLPEAGFYTIENELFGGSYAAINAGARSKKDMKTGTASVVGVKKHYWRWIPHDYACV